MSYSFSNLSRLYFGSFVFSTVGNAIVSILTYVYVFVFGVGTELNPVMMVEARVLGVWLIPAHMVSILAYYVLFYFTIKHFVLTKTKFRLWVLVLLVIPALCAYDLAFDTWSIMRLA